MMVLLSESKNKGKPDEMDLPYLKTISQIFYQLQKSRYIAEIKSLVQVVISY
jgi:hypothetical protein